MNIINQSNSSIAAQFEALCNKKDVSLWTQLDDIENELQGKQKEAADDQSPLNIQKQKDLIKLIKAANSRISSQFYFCVDLAKRTSQFCQYLSDKVVKKLPYTKHDLQCFQYVKNHLLSVSNTVIDFRNKNEYVEEIKDNLDEFCRYVQGLVDAKVIIKIYQPYEKELIEVVRHFYQHGPYYPRDPVNATCNGVHLSKELVKGKFSFARGVLTFFPHDIELAEEYLDKNRLPEALCLGINTLDSFNGRDRLSPFLRQWVRKAVNIQAASKLENLVVNIALGIPDPLERVEACRLVIRQLMKEEREDQSLDCLRRISGDFQDLYLNVVEEVTSSYRIDDKFKKAQKLSEFLNDEGASMVISALLCNHVFVTYDGKIEDILEKIQIMKQQPRFQQGPLSQIVSKVIVNVLFHELIIKKESHKRVFSHLSILKPEKNGFTDKLLEALMTIAIEKNDLDQVPQIIDLMTNSAAIKFTSPIVKALLDKGDVKKAEEVAGKTRENFFGYFPIIERLVVEGRFEEAGKMTYEKIPYERHVGNEVKDFFIEQIGKTAQVFIQHGDISGAFRMYVNGEGRSQAFYEAIKQRVNSLFEQENYQEAMQYAMCLDGFTGSTSNIYPKILEKLGPEKYLKQMAAVRAKIDMYGSVPRDKWLLCYLQSGHAFQNLCKANRRLVYHSLRDMPRLHDFFDERICREHNLYGLLNQVTEQAQKLREDVLKNFSELHRIKCVELVLATTPFPVELAEIIYAYNNEFSAEDVAAECVTREEAIAREIARNEAEALKQRENAKQSAAPSAPQEEYTQEKIGCTVS